MNKVLRNFALAVFLLLLVPSATLADGMIFGPCGDAPISGSGHPVLGPCNLAGGGVAEYGGQAITNETSFRIIHSPVMAVGFAGQTNLFATTIQAFVPWTGLGGTVASRMTLEGVITITEPGASVDVVFSGLVGGPPLMIKEHFTESGVFSVTMFGDQVISDIPFTILSI